MPDLDTDSYVEALMSDDYCRCEYVTFADIAFDHRGEVHCKGKRPCNKPILREMNFWKPERIRGTSKRGCDS